jgi:outer membrane protein
MTRFNFPRAACLCGFLAIVAYGRAGDSLTLQAAIGLAVKNSAALAAADKGLDAADARTEQARSAWFPSAGGVVSYSNLGPVQKIDFPIGPGRTETFQLFPADNWDAHVAADYLLFDFGRREKSVRLAAMGKQGQWMGKDLAAKRLAYNTIVAFETLPSEIEIISAKRESIENLSRHLDFVKKKLSTGSTTEFEVLRSEVQLTTAKTELMNLENNLAKQLIEFRYLLGLPETAQVRCAGAFDAGYADPPEDSLVAASLKQRAEFSLLHLALQAVETQRAMARAELAPTLSAHVSAGAKNGYVPNLDQMQFDWVAGAQVNAPIFDGRRSHFRIKELQMRLDSLNTVLADLKLKVRTEVLSAIADFRSAHQNVVAADENVRLAAESRRIATLQYEAGTIQNLDLLDAEDKFTQAKLAKVLSEFRYTLSRFALMQVTGFDFVTWAGGGGK